MQPTRAVYIDIDIYIFFFPPLQTANVAYIQRKIQLSGFFCLSGWIAVPINPDKWSSTVLHWSKATSQPVVQYKTKQHNTREHGTGLCTAITVFVLDGYGIWF